MLYARSFSCRSRSDDVLLTLEDPVDWLLLVFIFIDCRCLWHLPALPQLGFSPTRSGFTPLFAFPADLAHIAEIFDGKLGLDNRCHCQCDFSKILSELVYWQIVRLCYRSVWVVVKSRVLSA